MEKSTRWKKVTTHPGPNCSESGQIIAQECYIRLVGWQGYQNVRSHGYLSPVGFLELTESVVKAFLFF